MSKPDDIPQAVWDFADRKCEPLVFDDSRLEVIARAIMAAKAEEREACAAIGDNPDAWMAFDGDFEANQVAAAIRSRT